MGCQSFLLIIKNSGLGTGTNVNTFIYDFPATEAGTYWIHSHDPGQYPKGIRGSLIITDDVTDIQLLKMGGTTVKYVDDFRPVTLSDWYVLGHFCSWSLRLDCRWR